jgi:hypothetical protein
MERETLERLVEEARNDPELFHALVFNPEETISKLDYINRREKAMIVALNPEDIIAGMVGQIRGPKDQLAVCGYSCENSCDSTCGSGSCFGTCMSDSCDHTCGARSCDVTVEVIRRDLSRVSFVRRSPRFR